MKHTPGPWRMYFVERNQRFHTGRWVWFAPDQNFPGHEVLVDVEKRNGTGEANARLIAAAPTMKETLEEVDVGLQQYMEKYGDHQRRLAYLRGIIMDALAKTEA